MNGFKIFAITILCIVALVLLDFGGEYYSLWSFGFFAPKYENVKRQVFENTKSYREGKRQEVVKDKFEYDKSDDIHVKNAIKAHVRQSFSDVNYDDYPPELINFINECSH